MPQANTATKKKQSQPSAGTIVWQWVTYGLWEWALIALSTLLSATLAYYFVDTTRDYEFVMYTLAALVCLLPLALIADRSYRRRESPEKTGFSGVVMVLNAVLVFLATVGALIIAVVSGLRLLIDTNASDGTVTAIMSALVVVVLGALLFARIVNPSQLQKLTKLFHWLVSAVAVITVVLAVAGPVVQLVQTRDDRAIERHASGVQAAVEQYVWDKGVLPSQLSDINFDNTYQQGAARLVSEKRIRYNRLEADTQTDGTKTYHYELCVTFERAKGTGKRGDTISTVPFAHPQGDACYEQRVTVKATDMQPNGPHGL